MQRWQCQIFNGTLETLLWSKISLLEKCLFLWVSPLPLINEKCAGYICRETANENKQFKETKTLISDSYLIRHSFQGYRCKSDTSIFAWRVTLHYAYSPFKNINMVGTQCYASNLCLITNIGDILALLYENFHYGILQKWLESRNNEESWPNLYNFEKKTPYYYRCDVGLKGSLSQVDQCKLLFI